VSARKAIAGNQGMEENINKINEKLGFMKEIKFAHNLLKNIIIKKASKRNMNGV
jgi:hypothetical protein